MKRIFVLIAFLLPTASLAQEAPSAAEAAADLRTLALGRDFEGAVYLGGGLPDDLLMTPEVGAWYVLSLVRDGQKADARAHAERLVGAAPASVWSHYAHAAALVWGDAEEGGEDAQHAAALAAADQALALAPDHPDALWIYAEVLLNSDQDSAVVAFVDEHVDRVDNPAELLALKGWALNGLSYAGRERDTAKAEAALAALEEALTHDPNSVNALHFYGILLQRARRPAEAYEHQTRAAALAPTSLDVHRQLWRTTLALPDRPPEEKQAEVEADVERMLEARPNSVRLLAAAASQYGGMGDDERQRALEDRVLALEPDGTHAEWIHASRYRAFQDEHRDVLYAADDSTGEGPALRAAYRQMLLDYVRRPHHHNETLLGNTYLSLFMNEARSIELEDGLVLDEELLETVQKMEEYETYNLHIVYPRGVVALAEHTPYYREAEAMARRGIDAVRAKTEEHRDRYDDETEYERALNAATASVLDALGWVYFQEGRLDEAEVELLNAYKLNPKGRDNLYHLGRLYEAKHAQASPEVASDGHGALRRADLDRAETYYVRGAMLQTPGTNPSDAALKALYEKRHGGLEGYEDYLARLEEVDREGRKAEVLGDRHQEPEAVPDFTLDVLGGGAFSSDDLRGKVAVINYWGIWCGWCVEEMPDLQSLHERYADADDVLILTLNNDENRDEVAPWMGEHAYTFPVLFDDGYVTEAGVVAFPTTWFIDPAGRIAFTKVGWSEKLVEEFGWRVEALREQDP